MGIFYHKSKGGGRWLSGFSYVLIVACILSLTIWADLNFLSHVSLVNWAVTTFTVVITLAVHIAIALWLATAIGHLFDRTDSESPQNQSLKPKITTTVEQDTTAYSASNEFRNVLVSEYNRDDNSASLVVLRSTNDVSNFMLREAIVRVIMGLEYEIEDSICIVDGIICSDMGYSELCTEQHFSSLYLDLKNGPVTIEHSVEILC